MKIGLDVIVKRHGWTMLAYVPRRDMPLRTRQFFAEGYDTAEIAAAFGYKESAVERWLHVGRRIDTPAAPA
jgi:hypothetical protein